MNVFGHKKLEWIPQLIQPMRQTNVHTWESAIKALGEYQNLKLLPDLLQLSSVLQILYPLLGHKYAKPTNPINSSQINRKA